MLDHYFQMEFGEARVFCEYLIRYLKKYKTYKVPQTQKPLGLGFRAKYSTREVKNILILMFVPHSRQLCGIFFFLLPSFCYLFLPALKDLVFHRLLSDLFQLHLYFFSVLIIRLLSELNLDPSFFI